MWSKRTSFSTYYPGTPERFRSQNFWAQGPPFYTKRFPAHSAFPVAPNSTTSTKKSSKCWPHLISRQWRCWTWSSKSHSFPRMGKSNLKAIQHKSYKINTNLYRNQCLGFHIVHVRAQMKNTTNTVNKALSNMTICLHETCKHWGRVIL